MPTRRLMSAYVCISEKVRERRGRPFTTTPSWDNVKRQCQDQESRYNEENTNFRYVGHKSKSNPKSLNWSPNVKSLVTSPNQIPRLWILFQDESRVQIPSLLSQVQVKSQVSKLESKYQVFGHKSKSSPESLNWSPRWASGSKSQVLGHKSKSNTKSLFTSPRQLLSQLQCRLLFPVKIQSSNY